MMKRLYIILLSLYSIVCCYAQIQQGFIRTSGTPTRKGMPVPNVTIRISGGSTVLSNSNGQFIIKLSGVEREGDLFQVTSVRKVGFELLDKDALNRYFVYSKSVPIEIVMVSSEELQKRRLDIEESARKNATQNYEKKLQELKKQLGNQKVSIQEYNVKIKELENQMSTFENLIIAMAEHYARTDYDKLDSINATINQYIEEGRLEEADTLINTKGDIVQRANDNITKGANLRKAEAEIDNIKNRIELNSKKLEEERTRLEIWEEQKYKTKIQE